MLLLEVCNAIVYIGVGVGFLVSLVFLWFLVFLGLLVFLGFLGLLISHFFDDFFQLLDTLMGGGEF